MTRRLLALLCLLLMTSSALAEPAPSRVPRSVPDADVARYEQLTKERDGIRLGVPVALLASGGGVGVLSTLFAVAFATSPECGFSTGTSMCISFHGAWPLAAGLAIGGFSLAALGGTLLGVRVSQRRTLYTEMQRLERGSTVDDGAVAPPAATLDLALDPGTGRLLLQGSF